MPSSRIKIKSVVRIIHSINAKIDSIRTRGDVVSGSAAGYVVTVWIDTVIRRIGVAFVVLKQRLCVGQVARARIAKDVVKLVMAVKVEHADLLFAVRLADV